MGYLDIKEKQPIGAAREDRALALARKRQPQKYRLSEKNQSYRGWGNATAQGG